MKKNIYSGRDEGIFASIPVLNFIDSIGADKVIHEYGKIWVYHLPNYGVTLRYEWFGSAIILDLFGDESKIGEVEKIIRSNS